MKRLSYKNTCGSRPPTEIKYGLSSGDVSIVNNGIRLDECFTCSIFIGFGWRKSICWTIESSPQERRVVGEVILILWIASAWEANFLEHLESRLIHPFRVIRRTWPSRDAVTTCDSLFMNLHWNTFWVCPVKYLSTTFSCCQFQMLILRSSEPETSSSPLLLKFKQLTQPRCSFKVILHCNFCTKYNDEYALRRNETGSNKCDLGRFDLPSLGTWKVKQK